MTEQRFRKISVASYHPNTDRMLDWKVSTLQSEIELLHYSILRHEDTVFLAFPFLSYYIFQRQKGLLWLFLLQRQMFTRYTRYLAELLQEGRIRVAGVFHLPGVVPLGVFFGQAHLDRELDQLRAFAQLQLSADR